MSQSLIIWCVIAALVLCTFLFRAIIVRRSHKSAPAPVKRHDAKHHHHFIEMSREKDMFFVPGDPIDRDDQR